MVHLGAGLTGAVLLGVAVLVFLYPIGPENQTTYEINELCTSAMGQFGQALFKVFGNSQVEQVCQQYKLLLYGILGMGLIGLILVIVGSVVPNKRN